MSLFRRHLFAALCLTALAASPSARAETMPLDGKWLFRLDPMDAGIRHRWFEDQFTSEVLLPGTTDQNAKGVSSRQRNHDLPDASSAVVHPRSGSQNAVARNQPGQPRRRSGPTGSRVVLCRQGLVSAAVRDSKRLGRLGCRAAPWKECSGSPTSGSTISLSAQETASSRNIGMSWECWNRAKHRLTILCRQRDGPQHWHPGSLLYPGDPDTLERYCGEDRVDRQTGTSGSRITSFPRRGWQVP